MQRIRAFVATGAIAMALAIPAHVRAQDMINNLPDYTSAWVMGDLMQRRGRDFSEPSKRPKVEKPTVPKARSQVPASELLEQATYRPSPDAQSRIEGSFVAYLQGRQSDGSPPELLRALVEDSPAGSPFARLLTAANGGGERSAIHRTGRDYADWLASMSYSERNLFDVHTAFLMHAWSIANGGVTISETQTAFRAIRDGLVEVQAGENPPKLLGRDNAQKQEEAQSFALLTALLVTAWSDADADERAVLSRGVEMLGRRLGVNLRHLKLTPRGFFPA